jgi:hypothetical protein
MENGAIDFDRDKKKEDGTRTFRYPDGRRVKLAGLRPYRNNNPGNVKYESDKDAIAAGALGRDKGGFAVFPDPETGKGVADAWWDRAAKEGKTVGQAVEKYVSGTADDKQALEANKKRKTEFEAKLRIKMDTPLNQLTKEQMDALKEYNRQLEGEKNGLKTGKSEPLPPAAPIQQPKSPTDIAKHGQNQAPGNTPAEPVAPAPQPPAQKGADASGAQPSAGRTVNAPAAPMSGNVNALASRMAAPQSVNYLSQRSPAAGVNALATGPEGPSVFDPTGSLFQPQSGQGYGAAGNGSGAPAAGFRPPHQGRQKLASLLPYAREAVRRGDNDALQRLFAGAKADPHIRPMIPPDFSIETLAPGQTKVSGTLGIGQMVALYRSAANPSLMGQIGKARPGRYDYIVKDGRVTEFMEAAPGDAKARWDDPAAGWSRIERDPGRRRPPAQTMPYVPGGGRPPAVPLSYPLRPRWPREDDLR